MKIRTSSPLPVALALAASAMAADPTRPDTAAPPALPGMNLVWNDEFAVPGKPDPAFWSSESGFVRNQELQWYQSANARCTGGVLRIEGRKERVLNPRYDAGGSDWKTTRQYAEYTSASITGRKTWQFGRIEVRARLDGQMGSWPAIWTLGSRGEWPTNGEVDIMEFYPSGTTPLFHANLAWGTATRWSAAWNSKTRPLSEFTSKDPNWLSKFHVWTMDWTRDSIRLGLDGTVMNAASLAKTLNNDGTNPFQDRPQYALLNLAIGANGGDPSKGTFPMVYEVDYIRVYQTGASSASRPAAPAIEVRAASGRRALSVIIPEGEGTGRLDVFSVSGARILSRPACSGLTEIDMSSSPKGIYWIRFTSPRGAASTRILL